jgi:DNA invertase Pin-like site-specific DNA recombinase
VEVGSFETIVATLTADQHRAAETGHCVPLLDRVHRGHTVTPQEGLFFHLFGSLAQYERALIKDRMVTGLQMAKSRNRIGGCPRAIDSEKLEAILRMLKNGTSKAAICRNFTIKRSTLYDALARVA